MLLHHIDNEVPAFGEWDSVVEAGASTIIQSAAAAFPDRGAVGLRVTIVGANNAYVQKTISHSLDPGGWICFGCWINVAVAKTLYLWAIKATDSTWDGRLEIESFGKLRIRMRDDGGVVRSSSWTIWPRDINDGLWHYLVIGFKRATSNVASDGEAVFYCNGHEWGTITGVDNYDRWASVDYAQLGASVGADDGFVCDFDEIKIADAYPEPFSPTPLTDYPEARRTVVLYREASADSREFADYCVSELEIPLANLCPLPNATANESLADYATFQTEVETDLAAWLALNPTVAANCSCFLLGHGVPGYFTSGGVKHSAISRLMNYGTAFSSQTANPLYNPATVARLTKTALGGKYLCTRIDADTLANAKTIIDRSLTVAALSAIPAADKLYSDETTYKASLACQHLRIITAALDVFDDDAFVWGDTGSPSFNPPQGTQAVFVDDSADSASSLRTGSDPCFYALTSKYGEYAAALGNSETADTFDAESFFEMLRIGGSLAEAFTVAIAHLDYTAVGIGSPLMTVAFQLSGYNVYRGLGGIEGIDWDNPIAYLMPGADSITFAQDLLPEQRYVYAVRAVSSAGVRERNTHVIAYVEPDEQGSLLPAPLARPTDPTVEVQQSSLLIGFTYLAPIGFAQADGFDVLSDNSTGQLDFDNPVATVERSRNDRFDFEVSITRPDAPVLLAVRARLGEQVGPVSEIVFVPPASGPASIKIL